MKFTIKDVKATTAIVEYDDGSWAEITHAGTTEEEFMGLVWDYSPKKVEAVVPAFALTVGMQGNVEAPAAPEEEAVQETAPQTPEELRIAAYGTPEDQLEFITERGLEAWQAHVEAIKATFPLEV